MTSVLQRDRRAVVDEVRAQRRRTLALFEDLTDAQWETIVTPRWRVREVAAHLITTDEGALTGRFFAIGLRAVPISEVERWNDEQVRRWADRPIPALLHGLDVWGRRTARALALPIASARVPSPFGKVSFSWLGGMRVYDEWVHGEDVRRALGLPADDDPTTLAPVARQLFAAIPVQTLPRIHADARGDVTVSFRGLDIDPFGIDLTHRRFGTALGGRGTRIDADPAALVMCAAGRDRWRDAEARGRLLIDGERAPAETFLDALLVV